ncbi:MAG: hypothetical protein ACREHF_03640 [Rhizomicrobium sp.]
MNEAPKIIGATGGAVGLSALALAFGACCVAPWAVTLLGVGGAVLLARLAFIQPYAVAATLALVGLSFWYAYRGVGAGETCTADKRTGLRALAWIGALAVLVIDAASFAPRFLS